jgi:hypothetical protein
MVLEQGYLLWVLIDEEGEIKGAVVTCFIEYPNKKALHIMLLGGSEGRSWKNELIDTLRAFAVDQGCDCIEASGRKGWERELKLEGAVPLWHTIEMPVKPVYVGG